MPRLVAHQHVMRERLADRPKIASLDGCTVEAIIVTEARALILEHEYLGTMPGSPRACYGLFAPDRELLGAVVFAVSPPEAHDLCGREHRAWTMGLQRGACVPHAPKNAASFLIRRACKQASVAHGWKVFFAYADPEAGEAGTIYKALGWTCLGLGIGRGSRRRERDEWRRPGSHMWRSSRILRVAGLTASAARAFGWEVRWRSPKFKFVWFEDRSFEALCRYPAQPYPERPIVSRSKYRAHRRHALRCLVCHDPLNARRLTRKTCSGKCRVRLHRVTVTAA